MKQTLLKLYKVKWRNTANTYIVSQSIDEEAIKNLAYREERCDDIVSVERIKLPAFDDDNFRKCEYVSLFLETKIY